MGCRIRDSFAEDHSRSSLGDDDALLFTTMCIIGLPVDVHVKDGSIYSGIFHTVSVDGDYGIILKKARMTKMGKCNTNVGKESLVDTLVIVSGDLVQVVAKGVTLPTDCVGGNITGDDELAVVNRIFCSDNSTWATENNARSLMDAKQVNQSRFPIQNENGFVNCSPPSIAGSDYDGKKLPLNQMRTSLEVGCGKTDKTNFGKIEADFGSSNSERQARDVKSKGNADDCSQKSELVKGKIDEKNRSLHSKHETDTSLGQVEAVEHRITNVTPNPTGNGLLFNGTPASVKAEDLCIERSTSTDSSSMSSAQGVEFMSGSHNLPAKSVKVSAPTGGTGSTKNAKEFKLNPAAKIFSPSFMSPNSATTAVPTTANMVYVPNSSPIVPVAGIQPENGFHAFSSRPSVPMKVAQYSNLTVGNDGSGSQFSQPIVGQLAHRAQPLRYGAHYTPVLSEPAYLQPSSPAVMVGRSGQLVFVHPVSHDLVHGATTISPIAARPLLNNVQFPKQQGGGTIGQGVPICVPPPVLTGTQQPFALESHIPFLQPGFPVSRPISVPGPNGLYGTKFS